MSLAFDNDWCDTAPQVHGRPRPGLALTATTIAISAPPAWYEQALCPQVDNDIFFPEAGGSPGAAKAICMRCQVREECLEYALANRIPHGIWGACSERERRGLLKEMPPQPVSLCPNGHNLEDGNRNCRQCAKDKYQRYEQRRKSGLLADGKPHGYNRYRMGCKCDTCMEAMREFNRARHRTRKAGMA
jgi:WhiB family redox-sensing transcriptional regulator